MGMTPRPPGPESDGGNGMTYFDDMVQLVNDLGLSHDFERDGLLVIWKGGDRQLLVSDPDDVVGLIGDDGDGKWMIGWTDNLGNPIDNGQVLVDDPLPLVRLILGGFQ